MCVCVCVYIYMYIKSESLCCTVENNNTVNQLYFTKKKLSRDFPSGPVVKTVLPMQGLQV